MTTDQFTDILAAAQQQRRDDAQASLARIVALRDQKKAIEQELNVLEGRLREALEGSGLPIVDGERGISAILKERRLPARIDLATVANETHGAEYLADAARALILSAALTPLRALRGKGAWADALLAAEMPGGVTYVLEVEAK